jgi:hypothetical protein
VERATGLEFTAGALEGNTSFDDIHDIDTAEEFLDE